MRRDPDTRAAEYTSPPPMRRVDIRAATANPVLPAIPTIAELVVNEAAIRLAGLSPLQRMEAWATMKSRATAEIRRAVAEMEAARDIRAPDSLADVDAILREEDRASAEFIARMMDRDPDAEAQPDADYREAPACANCNGAMKFDELSEGDNVLCCPHCGTETCIGTGEGA